MQTSAQKPFDITALSAQIWGTPRLGDTVRISPTHYGTIIQIATYEGGQERYYVTFSNDDGTLSHEWMPRSALLERFPENREVYPCETPLFAPGDICTIKRTGVTAHVTAANISLEEPPSYEVHFITTTGKFASAWMRQCELKEYQAPSATDGAQPSAPQAALKAPAVPPLAEGEINAGIVMANGRPSHYLILLPQQPDARMSWDDAMQWAASISADLPTRQESALLYANAGHAFERDWYWTGEQYAGDASYAWGQFFGSGYQSTSVKGSKGRVRAVRRFLID